MNDIKKQYITKINSAFKMQAINYVEKLAETMLEAWKSKKTIYLCGNGGSSGNATHLANDFLYGAGIKNGIGLRVPPCPPAPAAKKIRPSTPASEAFSACLFFITS